jgi:hypothetical protein
VSEADHDALTGRVAREPWRDEIRGLIDPQGDRGALLPLRPLSLLVHIIGVIEH